MDKEEKPTDQVESENTENVEGSESGDRDSEQLGEGGLKALKSERQSRKAAERKITELEQQLANLGKSAEEQQLDRVRTEAVAETRTQLGTKIVQLSVKTLAAEKGINADLAAKLIDTSTINIDADGGVDSDALSSQIDELVEKFPELRAKRDWGKADQGSQGRPPEPTQLTQTDLSNMTPQQIMQAKKEGRLNHLLKGQ